MGAGTTALVAVKNGRQYLGCELNPEYIKIAEKRIRKDCGLFLMDFSDLQET
jgi:DNA modification methylase